MTPQEARQWLADYAAAQKATGPTIFSDLVKDLTGGFNTQNN